MENSSPLYCIVPVCKVQLPEFISCSRTPTSKTSTTSSQTFTLSVSCIFCLPPRLPNDSRKGHSMTLCYPQRESARKSKKVTCIVFNFHIFGPCSLLRPCVLPCLLLPWDCSCNNSSRLGLWHNCRVRFSLTAVTVFISHMHNVPRSRLHYLLNACQNCIYCSLETVAVTTLADSVITTKLTLCIKNFLVTQ